MNPAANVRNRRNVLHNIRADGGVRLDNFIFLFGQLTGLFQNIIGDTDFADVMQ